MSSPGRPAEKPLSVAFVIARYPPALGGTEAQAASLAGHLREAGFEVAVYTQKLKDQKPPPLPGVIRMRPAVGGRISSAVFGLRVVLGLLRRRPDLIQAFLLSSPALFAAMAGRLIGRPVLAKLGGGGDYCDLATSRRSLAGRLRLRLVLQMADHFVTPSKEALSELLQAGVEESRCTFIPNGVDLSIFVPKAGGRDPSAERTVIFAGRLEAQKDPATLIRAWARVSGMEPPPRLLIIGEGSLRELIEEQVRSLGLSSSVSFAGAVPHDGMPGWYARGSVFVLPSFSEGLSNSLLEAMACGLAPVVSDIPANRAVFPPGSEGLFFNPGDEAALAARLVQVLQDGEMRSRISAEALRISADFSSAASARSYADLYDAITGRVPEH